uniref:Piezo TM1-24 domain-containing protein n=1 Tax=Tetraodon nigroviridis TaxID=99883 RepID=H3D0X4_TETNG
MVGTMMKSGGKVLLTALLGLTGIVLPSLSSLLYLLCFQVMCTWWAWRGRVPPALFRCVSVWALLYSASHFLLFYCYQLPSLQEAWPANRTSSSVLGLVSVVSVDCAAPWRLRLNPALSWFHFLNPLVLLLLYNAVASLWRNQLVGAEGAESALGGSCDMATATSDLSEEVTAPSADHSPAESEAQPTQSTAVGLDLTPPHHHSLSQSDTLETCVFEGDGWEEEEEEEGGRRSGERWAPPRSLRLPPEAELHLCPDLH